MRRLVWAFARRTYHIVGNLMLRLIYVWLKSLKYGYAYHKLGILHHRHSELFSFIVYTMLEWKLFFLILVYFCVWGCFCGMTLCAISSHMVQTVRKGRKLVAQVTWVGGSNFRLYGGSDLKLIYWWDGRGPMLGCLSGPPGFTCWISFAPVFSLIYCWVLIFAISLYYILFYMF